MGVNKCGGPGVEASQEAVEIGPFAKTFAERFVAGGRRGEAVQQGAKIEACAAGDDGELVAIADLGERGAGEAGVVAGGGGLVRVEQVEAVVGDAGAVGGRGFGGADVHAAIDRNRVAGEDFAVKPLGEVQRQR